MTEQDKNRQHRHAMEEEADMSGGTGGNMGGDLKAGQHREPGPGKQDAGSGAGGQPGRGSGGGQSDAG